jgi:hypothetical protein
LVFVKVGVDIVEGAPWDGVKGNTVGKTGSSGVFTQLFQIACRKK